MERIYKESSAKDLGSHGAPLLYHFIDSFTHSYMDTKGTDGR